jgi:hypothetical protein
VTARKRTRNEPKSKGSAASREARVEVIHTVHGGESVDYAQPYRAGLLDQARMQWHLGEWQRLATLGEQDLYAHPDRAKLAILASTARSQCGDHAGARHLARLAQEWNCDRRAMVGALVAGLHNSLARVSLLLSLDEDRTTAHFKASTEGVAGNSGIGWQMRARAEADALEGNGIPLARATTNLVPQSGLLDEVPALDAKPQAGDAHSSFFTLLPIWRSASSPAAACALPGRAPSVWTRCRRFKATLAPTSTSSWRAATNSSRPMPARG